MNGKKLSYIPALSVILIICGSLVGGFVYLCVKDISKAGKLYKEINALESSKTRLESERANIKNTVNADQSYQEYFRQWENIEGRWDDTRILSKLSELAEQSQVRVFESSVSSEENIPEAFGRPSSSDFAERASRGRPSRGSRMAPSTMGGANPSLDNSKVSSVELTLLGGFPGLMNWISQVENTIGSARVQKMVWTARSSEEVRLSVTVQYRKFR